MHAAGIKGRLLPLPRLHGLWDSILFLALPYEYQPAVLCSRRPHDSLLASPSSPPALAAPASPGLLCGASGVEQDGGGRPCPSPHIALLPRGLAALGRLCVVPPLPSAVPGRWQEGHPDRSLAWATLSMLLRGEAMALAGSRAGPSGTPSV